MKSRHMSRYMFPRTMDHAFNTPRYASALERPWPPFWRRLFQSIKEILA